MKYDLFDNARNEYDDIDHILYQVLENRGVVNPPHYIKMMDDASVTHDFNLLTNIDRARDRYLKAIENNENIHILVDCDVDGYSSTSMVYNYTVNDMGYNNVSYSIHTGKQHGLSKDIIIPEGVQLLIIPDASSNEQHKHKQLKEERDIDIIILDHHEVDNYKEEEQTAIIVNNQLCDYPNKELSGAGIVYKFLQAVDEEMWQDCADKYLDLVALSLIGDSMDIRELETRHYINKGLRNVRNEALKGFIDRRAWDMKGKISMNNIAFLVSPLINAIIRIGKQDEKDLMFKAFTEQYMTLKYKKRGEDELIDEVIYERVPRLATNARSRQARQIDKALEIATEAINNNKSYENNLIVVDGDGISKSLTGILAIKIASQYKKPCIVIRKDEKTGLYSGSGRNIDYSSIDNLRDYINQTGFANAEGHDSAFGIMDLKEENIDLLVEHFNNDDSVKENVYLVDFIVPFDNLSDELIYTLNQSKEHWGMG
ncbi:MAG TPA: DHH family phosphoesterase, partial [Tissierellaceae bacterium]|nr:DHH family phosphoesterase [Tissierellaceae bacterium]